MDQYSIEKKTLKTDSEKSKPFFVIAKNLDETSKALKFSD